MSLLGAFQFNNAAIAVTLFLLWLQRARPGETGPRSKPRYGRACARRAGPAASRYQADPLTVIDVGHTPDGIRQSLASLKAIHGAEGWILVTGVSFDKKADEIVGALAPSFDTIICTRRITRARTRRPSPPRRARPIRKQAFTSPRPIEDAVVSAPRSPRRRIEKYMSPADYSWRSNTLGRERHERHRQSPDPAG
jgi:folylpolyglutamate synthase/dihydropteroate synthase